MGGAEEIRRVVTVFRELRQGVTEDGRAKVKSPSGTLSTAEAISVVTSGLVLAAHFGDGVLRPADMAGGITGAVVQNQSPTAWCGRNTWRRSSGTAMTRTTSTAPAATSPDEHISAFYGVRHAGPDRHGR